MKRFIGLITFVAVLLVFVANSSPVHADSVRGYIIGKKQWKEEIYIYKKKNVIKDSEIEGTVYVESKDSSIITVEDSYIKELHIFSEKTKFISFKNSKVDKLIIRDRKSKKQNFERGRVVIVIDKGNEISELSIYTDEVVIGSKTIPDEQLEKTFKYIKCPVNSIGNIKVLGEEESNLYELAKKTNTNEEDFERINAALKERKEKKYIGDEIDYLKDNPFTDVIVTMSNLDRLVDYRGKAYRMPKEFVDIEDTYKEIFEGRVLYDISKKYSKVRDIKSIAVYIQNNCTDAVLNNERHNFLSGWKNPIHINKLEAGEELEMIFSPAEGITLIDGVYNIECNIDSSFIQKFEERFYLVKKFSSSESRKEYVLDYYLNVKKNAGNSFWLDKDEIKAKMDKYELEGVNNVNGQLYLKLEDIKIINEDIHYVDIGKNSNGKTQIKVRYIKDKKNDGEDGYKIYFDEELMELEKVDSYEAHGDAASKRQVDRFDVYEFDEKLYGDKKGKIRVVLNVDENLQYVKHVNFNNISDFNGSYQIVYADEIDGNRIDIDTLELKRDPPNDIIAKYIKKEGKSHQMEFKILNCETGKYSDYIGKNSVAFRYLTESFCSSIQSGGQKLGGDYIHKVTITEDKFFNNAGQIKFNIIEIKHNKNIEGLGELVVFKKKK